MGTGAVEPFDAIFKQGRKVDSDAIYNGEIDCLVIWGGSDISPSIYNEAVGPRTGATAALSHRDHVEVAACAAAINMGIPIIGVCRGAQLLCAMAGGKLVQDVQNHAGSDHYMTTNDGRSIITSSVHHQMMYPWEVDHELIAWADHARSRDYIGVDARKMMNDEGNMVEPEIVYFPTVKGLAIQGHPEFMNPNCEFVKYCLELVNKYLVPA